MPPLVAFSPAVVSAVWSQARAVRNFHHGPFRCPTSPAQAGAMLAGRPVPTGCEDCYDLLVDCVLLMPEHVADPPAYAARLARNLCVDRMRQANAALHGVSKPERRDGVVGQVRGALRPLPDGEWLDELLTLLLRTAAARGPVPRTTWPLAALADARAASGAAPGDLRAEIELVLAAVARVAGPQWFDDHLRAPLRARAAGFEALRIGEAGTPDVPASTDDVPAAVAIADAFWERLSGNAPAAVRAATAEVTGRTPPRALAARVAVTLVADLPELRASHQAVHGRPTPESIRAAVARRCTDEIGAALDEPTVRGVHKLACRIPIQYVGAAERRTDAA